VRRVFLMLVTLVLLSMLIFALVEIVPGDTATMMLGQFATGETLEALRHKLGLDLPLYVRYLKWVSGILRGDLGQSLYLSQPVLTVIQQRITNSVILAGVALGLAAPVGISLGVLAGLTADRWPDQVTSFISLLLVSAPEFVSGVFLILIFSLWLDLLPPASATSLATSPLDNIRMLVLPGLTLLFMMSAHIVRMTRTNVAEVMQSAYVRAAVLKGLPMRTVVVSHVLRNALLPTITVIALSAGWLVGGLIIVENVFSYPGLGQLMLTAIKGLDAVLLEGCVLLMATVTCVANLIADILGAYLNPRIRYR
jgi:peptide/nickel transport system permease protein